MRSPSRPDTQDFTDFEGTPSTWKVSRDPSVPDRERIDSDVRGFMRPVSTPWIVFDRDSRVEGELAFAAKAAMRAGVAFMSSPDFHVPAAPTTPSAASRLADINAMFPPSVPHLKTATNDEPSSLIVAADVVPTERQASLSDLAHGAKKSGRMGLISASLAAVGICSVAAYIVASVQLAPAPAAAAVQAPPKVEAFAAGSPAAAPPAPVEPVLELKAEEPVAAVAPAEVVGEKATDPTKRWGKLTIKGDATKKQVWFDGKRMLGTGNRTFLVYCGQHTVAVTDKTAAKDTEVPCNGELTIEK